MKKKCVASILALGLSVVMFTVGCGGSKATTDDENKAKEEQQVTLKIMHHMSEEAKQKGLQDVVDSFMEQNADIKIELEFIEERDYLTNLKTKIASGDAPDFIHYLPAKVPELIEAEQVVPLDESALGGINKSLMESVTFDGKVYAIPLDVGGMGYFYNKDMFEEAGITELPKTFSEFVKVCDTLSKGEDGVIASGFKDGWTMQTVWESYMYGTLSRMNESYVADAESGKVKFADNKLFKLMAEDFEKLMEYCGNEAALGKDYATQCAEFASGKYPICIQGSWAVSQIRAGNQDANIGYASLPMTENPEDLTFAAQVDDALMLSSQCEHSKEAKKFIDYLATTEAGEIFSKNAQVISAVQDVDSSNLDPTLQEIQKISQSDEAYYFEKHPRFSGQFSTDFTSIMTEWGTNIITGNNMEIEELAKTMDDDFENIRATQ